MKKRTLRVSKKQKIIIIATLIVIAAAVAGAYFLFDEDRPSEQVSSEVNEEVKNLNLTGDAAVAGEYVNAVKSGDAEKAQQVFEDRLNAATDTQEKLDILSQNVAMALRYDKKEDALRAAERAVKLQPSYETYADAFNVYTVMGNNAKQREMLVASLASVQKGDRPDKDMLVTVLSQQLEVVNQQTVTPGQER